MSAIPEFLVTKKIELETGFSFVPAIGSVVAIAPEGVIMINHKFVDLSKEVVQRGLISFEELVAEAVSHEMLHKILFELEDFPTSKALDKIAYAKDSKWTGGM